jgi:hypothetical protein
LLCAAVVVVLVASACGSHKMSVNQIVKVNDCIDAVTQQREVDVLNRLIDKGAITRAQVVRQFPSTMRASAYLDKAGRLRAFARLPHDAQAAVVGWVHHLENTSPRYSKQLFHAETYVSDQLRRRCGASAS